MIIARKTLSRGWLIDWCSCSETQPAWELKHGCACLQAYLQPAVDDSREKFSWSVPNLVAIRLVTSMMTFIWHDSTGNLFSGILRRRGSAGKSSRSTRFWSLLSGKTFFRMRNFSRLKYFCSVTTVYLYSTHFLVALYFVTYSSLSVLAGILQVAAEVPVSGPYWQLLHLLQAGIAWQRQSAGKESRRYILARCLK
jgi:hypothetical protein